ncbi:MAG TPA: hypothetical protein VG433_07375 [Pirellulales bacterium]|nr:hypothetical protein [Pirellulales bacterium]
MLIVGPLGQGVGLAADALALAAAESGSPVATADCTRPALGRRACAALVRLGGAAGASPGAADLLLAFGMAAAVEARPLLSPTGSGLVLAPARRSWRLGAALDGPLLDGPLFDGPLFDERMRCWPRPASAAVPITGVWTLLGWLSARVALPQRAWRPALEGSVPRRLSAAAQLAFAQGRAIDGRRRRF